MARCKENKGIWNKPTVGICWSYYVQLGQLQYNRKQSKQIYATKLQTIS